MQENKTISNSTSFALASKVKDYFQLIKFTLSFMVVFSTVVSYLLAPKYSGSTYYKFFYFLQAECWSQVQPMPSTRSLKKIPMQ